MPILEIGGVNTAAQQPVTQRNDELGKDDFLRLFITKLANQNPMSPMEDQDFIAQMAQFSQLEQLTNLNKQLSQSLEQSALMTQTITNTLSTQLIGRIVRVQTNGLVLGETGTTDIRFDLAESAAKVTFEIANSDGALVRALRMEAVPQGPQEINWDGNGNSGNRLPAGSYRVTIRAEDAEGNPIVARAYFSGTVDGVRYVDGAAFLTVDEAVIALASVIEVLANGDEE